MPAESITLPARPSTNGHGVGHANGHALPVTLPPLNAAPAASETRPATPRPSILGVPAVDDALDAYVKAAATFDAFNATTFGPNHDQTPTPEALAAHNVADRAELDARRRLADVLAVQGATAPAPPADVRTWTPEAFRAFYEEYRPELERVILAHPDNDVAARLLFGKKATGKRLEHTTIALDAALNVWLMSPQKQEQAIRVLMAMVAPPAPEQSQEAAPGKENRFLGVNDSFDASEAEIHLISSIRRGRFAPLVWDDPAYIEDATAEGFTTEKIAAERAEFLAAWAVTVEQARKVLGFSSEGSRRRKKRGPAMNEAANGAAPALPLLSLGDLAQAIREWQLRHAGQSSAPLDGFPADGGLFVTLGQDRPLLEAVRSVVFAGIPERLRHCGALDIARAYCQLGGEARERAWEMIENNDLEAWPERFAALEIADWQGAYEAMTPEELAEMGEPVSAEKDAANFFGLEGDDLAAYMNAAAVLRALPPLPKRGIRYEQAVKEEADDDEARRAAKGQGQA